MAKDKRFICTEKQGGALDRFEIWVDTQTGVNYIYRQSGYSGGLTVLLGTDGKPVVTPITPDLKIEE